MVTGMNLPFTSRIISLLLPSQNLHPHTKPSILPELHEHSPDHTTAAPTQPSPTQPSPGAEQHFPTPNESPLHVVHSHGSDEGSLKLIELTNLVTKLSDRVAVLEDDLRKTKKTYSSAFTKLITQEDISTAGRTVTYRRRSEEQRTRKDKGKAITTESEPKKKSKKELEQERLSFAEAIRLEEQMNEEQRAQIARDD
ncbi:hypothetical protein Tco_0524911 [Tanacetum coccineum]